jgi:hypothetical protein
VASHEPDTRRPSSRFLSGDPCTEKPNKNQHTEIPIKHSRIGRARPSRGPESWRSIRKRGRPGGRIREGTNPRMGRTRRRGERNREEFGGLRNGGETWGGGERDKREEERDTGGMTGMPLQGPRADFFFFCGGPRRWICRLALF